MSEKSYISAVQDAHREVLTELDDTFIMGEDIQKSLTITTVGLVDEFGEERVRDTPVSEQGFTGVGIGAAMAGKRPIVEYQINTLPHIAMEQLVNHSQKIHHMSNGKVSVPLTLTVPIAGAPGGLGPQHSDAPYSGFMHYGMKTIIPTTPYDAKGLFRSAVEEDDPVMLFFPVALQSNRAEVPDETYRVPLGEAKVRCKGSDVTIVAIGETVPQALSVAEEMDGTASIEVIDPRTLLPLDEETILDSVHKTGRIIIVDNANRTCGFAAEIAARISNRSLWDLDAPVKRVTRADAPISYSPTEENYVQPDEKIISEAVYDVLGR